MKKVNENPFRFEESITQCKVSTFANEGVNFKNQKQSADKVIELKMERNLFGRLTLLSIGEENLNCRDITISVYSSSLVDVVDYIVNE